jgi:lysozyme
LSIRGTRCIDIIGIKKMHPKNKVFAGVVGAALVASVTLWEGTRYTPYEDIVGVLTVCQGYTGKDIVRGKKYTPEQCKVYLAKELSAHGEGVLKCTNVPLTEYQYNAYTMFAYNVGTTGYCKSSLLKKLNAGDYKGACDGLLKWSYAGGKHIPGLYNRRVYERKMCLGELNG